MSINNNTFESGLAQGTGITTANSGNGAGRAFDNVTGAATYDATHAHSGGLSLKFNMAAGLTNQVRWIDTANQAGVDNWIRFYIYLPALPSQNLTVLTIADIANSFILRARIRPTGQMDLLDNVASGPMTGAGLAFVAAGQWVRIEAKVTRGSTTSNGSAELRVYNTADSASPDGVFVSSAAWNTGTANAGQWRFGGSTATAATDVFWIDDVASSDTGWIGAIVLPPNFPTDPADLDIEMNIGGTWTNLRANGYVLDRGISISRGRADEAGQIEPQKLSMTLDNTGGRFSPRNPTSPYYGSLGRNTPVRAYVRRGATYLDLPGSTDYVSVPDSVAMSITGDIDIRVDVTTSYWSNIYLAGKYRIAGNQRSWAFLVDPVGTLSFVWTTAGTTATADIVTSNMPIPMQPGRLALRVALDVSPTPTATFYVSDSISGTWTQLGDVMASSIGVGTSMFDSTAPIELGYITDTVAEIGGAYYGLVGRYNAFEMRSGIGGTVVANPTFTGLTLGATSVADTHSNTFTFQNSTAVSDKRWRFHGEMSSLPPRWDTSGNDAYVTTDVNGMLRRLRAANTPLHSSLYRQLTNNGTTAGYWSCEDDSGSSAFAAATPYTPAASFTPGTLSLASTTITGSESLPTMSKAAVNFNVPQYDASKGSVAFFFLYIPTDTAMTDGSVLATISTTGSVTRWDFVYYTANNGSIGVGVAKGSDESGTWSVNAPNGILGNELKGQLLLCSIGYKQSGTAMLWDFSTGVFGVGVGAYQYTVSDPPFRSAASTTGGSVAKITIDPGKAIEGVTFGHVGVWAGVPDSNHALIHNGYIGENGGDRMMRLCAEEGVPLRIIGNPHDMPPMGEQKAAAFTDLLQECADADRGMLFECRDTMSLCYRTRGSLYSQRGRLTLGYEADGVSDAIEPTDDDQSVRNDITVSRTDGSSARVQQTTGAMSVSEFPDGVGRYTDSQTYNLYLDDQLEDQAGWAVHLGTVDEARYPSIGINYAGAAFKGVAAMNEAALMLEIGDRLTVTDPPSSLPPDDIRQLVQGYSEAFGNYAHTQAFNGSPASPYDIARLTSSRVDTSGSQLASAYSATATSLSVVTTKGERWTTGAIYMPFDVTIGGERMTVTAISGTTTTQTFTVVRSVNGVVKAQAAGTAVNIVGPTYVGL